MALTEDNLKISIGVTLILMAGFFVFTSFFVLFDSSLGFNLDVPDRSVSGFAILFDAGNRDFVVLGLTLILFVSAISLVFYWHYVSAKLKREDY